MPASALESHIQRRLATADVTTTEPVVRAVAAYLELLARWNARINLTAFDLAHPTDAAIDRLIVEPIAAVQLIRADDRLVVDIGSGGGSPAIPMKLAAASLVMKLFESRTRKAAFLREAVRVLSLGDVDVETVRVDPSTVPRGLQDRADVVTLRAVRPDRRLWEAIGKLTRGRGRVFLFSNLVNKPITLPETHVWTEVTHDLGKLNRSLTVLTKR